MSWPRVVDWFKIWILPGFIFQSVIIGGGYASGREVVEYFAQYAGNGGWGFIITYVVFAACLVGAFEVARVFRTFDYRHFFRVLLGKGWYAFEVLYIVMIILVVAIVIAAGGSALEEATAISKWWGVALICVITLVLCYRGRQALEGYFTAFSFYLYGVYIAIIVATVAAFGPQISKNLGLGEPGWALAGFKYGLYNLVVIIAVLFALDVFKTRKQAVGSGLVAAAIGLIPGVLVWLVTVSQYPEIKEATVPTLSVTQELGTGFVVAYFIMLIATLIETGSGLVHAFNERMDGWVYDLRGTHMAGWQRLVSTAVIILAGIGLSTFGLVALVAKGYGAISWAFFALFFIPVVCWGIYRALHPEWGARFWRKIGSPEAPGR